MPPRALSDSYARSPRALPWAFAFRAFGAGNSSLTQTQIAALLLFVRLTRTGRSALFVRALTDCSEWCRRGIFEQRLSLSQIGGSETFGEPGEDLPQELLAFFWSSLLEAQAVQAHNGAQLPTLRVLLARNIYG